MVILFFILTQKPSSMKSFLLQLTRAAGKIIKSHYGKVGVEYTKTNQMDVVTKADLLINKLLVRMIKTKYPNHGIISEEMNDHQADAPYVWIIDPIDGTRNFVTHTPLFGNVIALARRGQVIMAAIFDPIHDELFSAEKNKGAFCNHHPIHCSHTKFLANSFGGLNANFKPEKTTLLSQLIKASQQHPFWATGFGSTAIGAAYVACGRRDWYISVGNNIWDYAGAALILSEAGCRATNLQGKPWSVKDNEIITANPVLHSQILKIAQAAYLK